MFSIQSRKEPHGDVLPQGGEVRGEGEQLGSEWHPSYLLEEEKFGGGLLVGQKMNFAAIRGSSQAACSTIKLLQEQNSGCDVCGSGTAFQEMALRNGARRGDPALQQGTARVRLWQTQR